VSNHDDDLGNPGGTGSDLFAILFIALLSVLAVLAIVEFGLRAKVNGAPLPLSRPFTGGTFALEWVDASTDSLAHFLPGGQYRCRYGHLHFVGKWRMEEGNTLVFDEWLWDTRPFGQPIRVRLHSDHRGGWQGASGAGTWFALRRIKAEKLKMPRGGD
jgi:hypothetical protein